MTPERYISLCWGVGPGGILIVLHHYMQWPLKDPYHYHLGCGGILLVPHHCTWALKDTYHYHLGWGGFGGSPAGSSLLHYKDDDPSRSGQTMAFDRVVTHTALHDYSNYCWQPNPRPATGHNIPFVHFASGARQVKVLGKNVGSMVHQRYKGNPLEDPWRSERLPLKKRIYRLYRWIMMDSYSL